MSIKSILIFLLPILLLLLRPIPIHCRSRHVINFRWPNLYPESFAWDSKSDHFIVGSLRHPHLISVTDAGVTSSLLHDDSLPQNSSFVGIAIDPRKRRVLAVVHIGYSPPSSALAAYDLTTSRRLLLVPLPNTNLPSPVLANDVAADYDGNAYVTDSSNNVVFKITEQGEPSILSDSKILNPDDDTVDATTPYHNCGLNGVVYNSKGYLLVTQSNTGKLFKVNADDGTARRVLLNKELTAADGIAVRKDGVVLVVSQKRMYFVKSDDSWSQGVVFDETALEEEGEASAVVVGAESRVYALYGRVNEGIMGTSSGREEFSIVQVESEEESKEEKIWIYVLVGLGLFWFMLWRFQMKKLVTNMDKKMS